jgi:hypothetical protein
MQAFEWYVPDDHKHWARLTSAIPNLKATGIDNIWVPPGCKASSPSGNGYDIYDLYDLGEFDQKGGVGTKWGTKDELLKLVNKANEVGVGIYWDAGKPRCPATQDRILIAQFSTTKQRQTTKRSAKSKKSTKMTATRPYLIPTKLTPGSDSTFQAEGTNTPSRNTIGIISPAPITMQIITRLLSTRSWETRRKDGPNQETWIARRETMTI